MNFLLESNQLNISGFNPDTDPIAVVLKSFKLKKRADRIAGIGIGRSEIYVVSIAIDQSGDATPSIAFNTAVFPNVKVGQTIAFAGQGHLIYGPKNPGSFVTYSILFVDSDTEFRELGERLEGIIKSEAGKIGLKTLLQAISVSEPFVTILPGLMELVAGELKKDKDDPLFRMEGLHFRDLPPAFDVLRTFSAPDNIFIDCEIAVLPLVQSNNLGSATKKIKL